MEMQQLEFFAACPLKHFGAPHLRLVQPSETKGIFSADRVVAKRHGSSGASSSMDALIAVTEVDANKQSNTSQVYCQDSQEYKAIILATEVYGVNASSMHDLNQKILKESNPIKIKNRSKL
jgi:hypothetical protein